MDPIIGDNMSTNSVKTRYTRYLSDKSKISKKTIKSISTLKKSMMIPFETSPSVSQHDSGSHNKEKRKRAEIHPPITTKPKSFSAYNDESQIKQNIKKLSL